MRYTYEPMKTDKERKHEALERGLVEYLKLFVVTSLILGLCFLASGQVGKAIDQELGIYKAHKSATK